MAETKNEIERARRDRARATAVVLGSMLERLDVLHQIDSDARRIDTTTHESKKPEYIEGAPTKYTPHIERFDELIDELRRSLLKKGSKEESE